MRKNRFDTIGYILVAFIFLIISMIIYEYKI